MGNRGSRTAKVAITGSMHVISKWTRTEMDAMFMRATSELSDYFALNFVEFEILLGRDVVNFLVARDLYDNVFKMQDRGVADKFEVMCVICLASQLTSTEKIGYMFDIFNFNSKGFLVKSEITFLMIAAVKGSNRVDKTVKVLTDEQIETLVWHIFKNYAAFDPNTLRKPEVIKCGTETLDIRLFMDAWRGHSGQVLLKENEKWKDFTFQAYNFSVTPSNEWLILGLPPSEFIRWRRKEALFPVSKEKPPFNISELVMKTQDRRVSYSGTGILATGTIRRGLLADKWLMTAFGCVTAKPPLMYGLFGVSGQEEQGRYAIRLFEGTGWRTIYVDDRIPCSLDGFPLFSRSSDPYESGIMLVEKAVAKYFGSYGHVGICGTRVDAPFVGMRMLTGGHIVRYNIDEFDWKSMPNDVQGQDGTTTVFSWFKEGSIVSFGLSEVKLLHRSTLERSPSKRPPHGFLFPMVGIDDIEGYKYVILKDPHGVVTDYISENTPELISGHCRTFRVRVELLKGQFDNIVVSRFPDLARIARPGRLKLASWHSEFVKHTSRGVSKPAVFVIRIYDKNYSADDLKPPDKYSIKAMLRSFDPDYGSNLKRKKGKPKPSVKEEPSDQDVLAEMKTLLDTLRSEIIDVAFTISSAVEWIYSGAPAVNAQTKIVLVPSKTTRDRYVLRDMLKLRSEQKLAKLVAKLKKANEQTIEYAQSAEEADAPPPVEASVPEASGGADGRGGAAAGVAGASEGNRAAFSGAPNVLQNEESYQHVFTNQSSCVSKSLKLIPGIYFMFADISYDLSNSELIKKSLSCAHPHERPWLEHRDPADNSLILHISSHSRFLVSKVGSPEQMPKHTVDLSKLPDTLPRNHFVCEAQSEAASRGLINMLSDIKLLMEREESKLVVIKSQVEDISKAISSHVAKDRDKDKK